MENLPGSIQEKLEQGEWGWVDLPTWDDATSWSDVETACGLTKQELSRVKNARCPGKHRVSIALSALKSLYNYHLISPTRLLLSVK